MNRKEILNRLDALLDYYREYRPAMPKEILLTCEEYIAVVMPDGNDNYRGIQLVI